LPASRIAADPAALARDADVEERLTEEIGAAGVGDEPMRGSVARMDVRVDESRAHQFAARVDLDLGSPVEAAAHVGDAIVLVDHDALGDERVRPLREADDPAAPHKRPHGPR